MHARAHTHTHTHTHTRLSLSPPLSLSPQSCILSLVSCMSWIHPFHLVNRLYTYTKSDNLMGRMDFCASSGKTDDLVHTGSWNMIPQCCIMYSLGFILFCGCSVFCYKCGWQICKWRVPGTCLFVDGTWVPTFQRNLLSVKWWYGSHLPYHFESDPWKHNLNSYCHKNFNSYMVHRLLQ